MADIDPTINPSTTASVDAVAAIQSLSSANVSGATDSAVTLEGMSGGMVRGSSGTAINPISKQPVAFDWVAAPVGSLITSNDPVTLAPNEAYNQAYQGRNREAVTSEMLVNDIANNPIFGLLSQSATTDIGAPMFAPNGAVLAGNAREMGLERGASLGTRGAGQYQEQLRVSASQYGINAADLDANIFYTLTRQITSPMDAGQYAQFAAESNIPSTTGMTQLDLARFDASRMQAAGSFGLLHGAVSPTAANTQFFTSFASTLSSSERSTIVNEEGMLSPAGVGRAQRAVQAYAYPDDSILARMMETTDDESAAVSRGLRSAAPDIARLRSSIASGAVAAQYGDILGPLNEAVGVYSGIREQGGTSTDVAAYLANGDLGLGGGISDWGRSLLGVLQTPSQIGPTLKEYARRSMNTADQRNGNLPFDDAPGLATAEALYNSIVPGQLGIADDGSAATVPIRIVDTTGAVSSAAASGVTRVKESRFMSRFRRTVGSGGIDSYEEQYYSQFGAEAPVEGFAPWLQSEYGVGPQMRAPTASEWRARTAGDDQSFVGVLPPVITPYGEGRPVRSGLPALIPAEVPSERVVGADGRLNTPVNNKGARAVLPPDDGAVSRSDATLAGDVAVAEQEQLYSKFYKKGDEREFTRAKLAGLEADSLEEYNYVGTRITAPGLGLNKRYLAARGDTDLSKEEYIGREMSGRRASGFQDSLAEYIEADSPNAFQALPRNFSETFTGFGGGLNVGYAAMYASMGLMAANKAAIGGEAQQADKAEEMTGTSFIPVATTALGAALGPLTPLTAAGGAIVGTFAGQPLKQFADEYAEGHIFAEERAGHTIGISRGGGDEIKEFADALKNAATPAVKDLADAMQLAAKSGPVSVGSFASQAQISSALGIDYLSTFSGSLSYLDKDPFLAPARRAITSGVGITQSGYGALAMSAALEGDYGAARDLAAMGNATETPTVMATSDVADSGGKAGALAFGAVVAGTAIAQTISSVGAGTGIIAGLAAVPALPVIAAGAAIAGATWLLGGGAQVIGRSFDEAAKESDTGINWHDVWNAGFGGPVTQDESPEGQYTGRQISADIDKANASFLKFQAAIALGQTQYGLASAKQTRALTSGGGYGAIVANEDAVIAGANAVAGGYKQGVDDYTALNAQLTQQIGLLNGSVSDPTIDDSNKARDRATIGSLQSVLISSSEKILEYQSKIEEIQNVEPTEKKLSFDTQFAEREAEYGSSIGAAMLGITRQTLQGSSVTQMRGSYAAMFNIDESYASTLLDEAAKGDRGENTLTRVQRAEKRSEAFSLESHDAQQKHDLLLVGYQQALGGIEVQESGAQVGLARAQAIGTGADIMSAFGPVIQAVRDLESELTREISKGGPLTEQISRKKELSAAQTEDIELQHEKTVSSYEATRSVAASEASGAEIAAALQVALQGSLAALPAIHKAAQKSYAVGATDISSAAADLASHKISAPEAAERTVRGQGTEAESVEDEISLVSALTPSPKLSKALTAAQLTVRLQEVGGFTEPGSRVGAMEELQNVYGQELSEMESTRADDIKNHNDRALANLDEKEMQVRIAQKEAQTEAATSIFKNLPLIGVNVPSFMERYLMSPAEAGSSLERSNPEAAAHEFGFVSSASGAMITGAPGGYGTAGKDMASLMPGNYSQQVLGMAGVPHMGGIAGHTPIQQQIYGRMAPNLSFGAAGVSPTITTFGAASGSLIGDMRNVSTIDPSSMSAAAQIIAAAVKDAIRDGMKSGRSSGVNGPGITNTNAFKSGVGLGGNG